LHTEFYEYFYKKHLTHTGSLLIMLSLSDAPVAQLDRVSGYEPEGRAFESLRVHH
jgi:hypothetical protein